MQQLVNNESTPVVFTSFDCVFSSLTSSSSSCGCVLLCIHDNELTVMDEKPVCLHSVRKQVSLKFAQFPPYKISNIFMKK